MNADKKIIVTVEIDDRGNSQHVKMKMQAIHRHDVLEDVDMQYVDFGKESNVETAKESLEAFFKNNLFHFTDSQP